MSKILNDVQNEILQNIEGQNINILSSLKHPELEVIKNSVRTFINNQEVKLEKWTVQLAENEITTEEYEFLIKGMKNLIEMSGLTARGLSEVELEKIKSELLVYFIRTVFRFVKKVL